MVTESNISGWQLAVNPAGNWEFRTGRGNVGAGSAWNLIEGPASDLDEWTHLVGTYDGADMRFYVDGSEVGALLGVAYLPVDSFFFFIHFFVGASFNEDVSGTGDAFWIGDVDEVALYGQALSPTRIQAHYDAATQPALTLAEITGVAKTGGQIVLSWDSDAKSDYQLRRSPDRSSWVDVGGSLPGTGGTLQQGEPLAAGTDLSFYRVEVSTP